MLSRATYCTREDVLNVLQVSQSPRAYPAIDRAIESATRSIDHRTRRRFHPTIATRSFLWPEPNSTARSWRVWLDAHELISATTVTSGGTVIPAGNYFLEPQASGPPYTHIETNQGSISAFSSGPSTQQRSLSILGLYGYTDVVQAVTTLAVAITTTTATTLQVNDGSQIGVGDLLSIDTERLAVTGRSLITSAQSLQTPLTAAVSGNSVAVTTGSAFAIGEVITLDSEQMLILDIAANNLIVQRAINSSVLATHTGSTIYVPRVLTVLRAQAGSTAATHLISAPVSRQVVPSPVHSLAVAEAIVELQAGAAGYATDVRGGGTAGSGDNVRPVGGGLGLADLRDAVDIGYRRKARIRAV